MGRKPKPLKWKHKHACDIIRAILQEHSLEYIKLRYNQFTWSNRHDKSGCEEHKKFKTLYEKYIRNKKIIDGYHKKQCCPSPSSPPLPPLPCPLPPPCTDSEKNGSILNNSTEVMQGYESCISKDLVVCAKERHRNANSDKKIRTEDTNSELATTEESTVEDSDSYYCQSGNDDYYDEEVICGKEGLQNANSEDSLHFKPRQEKTKKDTEKEATSALLMLAGNDHSSSATSNNDTSNTTSNTNTSTTTFTNSTSSSSEQDSNLTPIMAKNGSRTNEQTIPMDVTPNVETIRTDYDGGENLIKDGTSNGEAVETDDDNGANIIRVCSPNAETVDMDNGSGTNQMRNGDTNGETVQIDDVSVTKQMRDGAANELSVQMDNDGTEHMRDTDPNTQRVGMHVNDANVEIGNKLQQDHMIEICKLEAKLLHCMNEKDNEIFKLKNEVKSKEVAIIVDIRSGKKLEQDRVIDIRKLQPKLSHCTDEKTKLEQHHVIQIHKFQDKISHSMNETDNEILKIKNEVKCKEVAITKIMKDVQGCLNDKTNLMTRIDEVELLHRNQMLLLKHIQEKLRIANVSVEERIVSVKKMEHQHRIEIRNLEYKLSLCMNGKSKMEQHGVIQKKPNVELGQSAMNGKMIEQQHEIRSDANGQTIQTHTCITSPTFPPSTNGVRVGIYAHKKSKCKNICIKMNNNTLISWLHNLETDQKTLTDLDYSMVNTVDRLEAKKINNIRDDRLWCMDFKSDFCHHETTYLVMEIPFNGMGHYMYRVAVNETEMKGMVAIERASNQIYVTENLHKIFHSTKGQRALELVQNRYGPNKTVILSNNKDCHGTVPYGVLLNRPDIPTVVNTYQVGDSFGSSILQRTQQLTHALILSDEKIMEGIIRNGQGSRGTYSIDASFSSQKGKNLDRDEHNNCIPTLTVAWKKWFKNSHSKKLLGELAIYVIEHVLPLRFDLNILIDANKTSFLEEKHSEFLKELQLDTDISNTPFLVEGFTIGFASRLKNHFDFGNDYRPNRNWIVGLRHLISINCFPEQIQNDLLNLGFKDSIHLMVIFYTRRVLGKEK